jgi:hypothetical protein
VRLGSTTRTAAGLGGCGDRLINDVWRDGGNTSPKPRRCPPRSKIREQVFKLFEFRLDLHKAGFCATASKVLNIRRHWSSKEGDGDAQVWS